MARHDVRAGYIRGSLDLIDSLEADTPDESDYSVFYDTTDGRAKRTGIGAAKAPVTAVTATPTALVDADSGKTLTNEGAAAQIEFDLPTAVEGLQYTFIVQDTDGILIVANTGDTINNQGSVSDSAGNIYSNTIGDVVSLLAINATEWIVTRIIGNWFIT